MIQHHPGFHTHSLPIGIEFDRTIEVRAGVNDERLADRLTALRGSCATRKHRDLLIGSNLYR